MEEYEEVQTEYNEDITVSDVVFITAGILLVAAVFAFVMKTLRKNVKNIHLKIGDKIEVGVETKEEK